MKYNGSKLENGLYYSDSDILKMYNGSRDKNEQIKILAQLNLCKVEDIRQALIRAGINRFDNGLYYTDKEILDMYNKHIGDKRFCLDNMAKMNDCTVEDIKTALLRAGLSFRNLPRKRKTDTVYSESSQTIEQKQPNPLEVIEEPIHTDDSTLNTENTVNVVQAEPEIVETYNVIPQAKLLEFVQNAVHVYQDALLVKKNNLEVQIQDLENNLIELRKKLDDCNTELNVSKHMFN